ncbi:hypothetical protein L1278_001653 [Pontibacter sp. HSC-36F09]|nr:hypothetical protein [Pontibacter sp. HSC-36F09]
MANPKCGAGKMPVFALNVSSRKKIAGGMLYRVQV